jgi:hypothetical protein
MSDLTYRVKSTSSGSAKGLSKSQLWKTEDNVKKAHILVALDTPCRITKIQGKNYNSAYIEVYVANGNYDNYDPHVFTEFLTSQPLRTSSQIELGQRTEEKFSFEKQLNWKLTQRKTYMTIIMR